MWEENRRNRIERHSEKLLADADADRAARAAGYKSVFKRLRERLLPRRREKGG
jgi:hypothetical protein